MQLHHLSLTNYRNFSRLDVDVPLGAVVLLGDNAQGKTSLLEAVFFLATMISFQAESDRQLINFLSAREPLAVARVVADFERGGIAHRLETRIIQDRSAINGAIRIRKEALLDGVKLKLSEAIGQLNAVLFLPQMMRIVDGSPEDRRRYLNLSLAQVKPSYAATLTEYRRVVSNRNALLKQLNERSGDPQQLDYWDANLAELGARIIHARIQAIKELEQFAKRLHQDLTRSQEVLRMNYQPSFDPFPDHPGQYAMPLDAAVDRSGFSVDEIATGFQAQLARVRAEEIARGVTTTGPHRDDLRFLGNGIDLGVYGSRGQVRTTLLTLKLAEVSWMKEKTGHWPVVLLDEVLAELDTSRREDLLTHVADCRQALLTTTDLNLFEPDFIEQSTLWTISGGRLMTKK